jgi:hypothetical protein
VRNDDEIVRAGPTPSPATSLTADLRTIGSAPLLGNPGIVARWRTRGSTAPAWSNRAWVAGVVGVVVVGVVFRVVYVLVVLDDVPSGLDSIAYQLLGGSIRAGTGYVVPTSMFTGEYTPTAAFPPLYPAYQALWQSVFDAGPTSVRMAGMVPAAATITLTAILGRRAVGPRVGLAAAAIVAVHPGLIAADGSAMSESLTVPLVLAAQLLALCLADSGHGRLALAVALGPVLGLAILTRQDLVLFGGILVVWLMVAMPGPWRAKATVGAIVAVGTALVVTPWVVRNANAVDVVAVSTLSPASALAGANCPSSYHGPGLGSWDYACVAAARPSAMSEADAAERGLTERELTDDYRSAAVAHVRENLDRLPLVVAARQARAWSIWDPRDLARRDADESRRYGFQVRARPIEGAFAVAGAVGLVVLLRRRGLRAFVLVAPVLAVAVSVAVSYGNPRFNVTAQPSLAIAVAALAGYWLGRWRQRRSA